MTMPAFLENDLKEIELSKQRALEELRLLGVDTSLIPVEEETLESLEITIGQIRQLQRRIPQIADRVGEIYNAILRRSA